MTLRKLAPLTTALMLLSGASVKAENSSFVDQSGQGNRTRVDQAAAIENVSAIQQAGTNNIAEVRHVGGAAVHSSIIEQIGSKNVAGIEQGGNGGSAASTILQKGDGNYVGVAQRSNAQSTSFIQIEGDKNAVATSQRHVTGPNDASAVVIGVHNDIRTLQDGGGNQSETWATGDRNYVGVEQFGISASHVAVVGADNRVSLTQR